MKVLIVDDERHVREAIKLLVDWESLGIERILEADNGETACEAIERERPEIVVTDMRMPIQDGVDLLAWIQRSGRPIRTLVVSGHDDFELVRSTMKYGGADYLLKPIDPEQLQESLGKAIADWRREDLERQQERRRNIEMNRLKPAYWDKIFSNLVTDPGTFASVRDSLGEEFRLDRAGRCQVVVLGVDTMNREVMDKFRLNRDLLFFSLTNVCNEFLRPDNRGFAFRYWNSANEILLLFWARFDEVRETLERMETGLCLALKCRFDLGLGTIEPFPSGVGASCQAARAALRRRDMRRRTAWLHEAVPAEPGVAIASPRVLDYEESFRLAVLGGGEAEIAAAAGRWFEAVGRLPSISLEQLELWRIELEAMRERWAKELPCAESGGGVGGGMTSIPLDDDGCLSLGRWREELTASLLRLAERRGGERSREKNVMADIARYVETHYSRELSLQDIADRFFLSREYISRRFKQDFGENLSDFLSRVRISKAKLLLGNPELRIAEIAEMVGFADEKYFSKVFKKLEGVSPNQFRKGTG